MTSEVDGSFTGGRITEAERTSEVTSEVGGTSEVTSEVYQNKKTPPSGGVQAPSAGIEPATVGLEVRCSVH